MGGTDARIPGPSPRHTPLLPRVPREFLQFLEEGAGGLAQPDYCVELAHYE
jgi:hypothetical protein